MNKVSILYIALSLPLLVSAAHAQRGGGGDGSGGGRGAEGVQGKISGTVLDSTRNAPLQGATVTLRRSNDSTLVTGAIAGRDGKFSIEGLAPGRYYARVTYVGYAPKVINGIAVQRQNLDVSLGNIALAPDATRQQEVTVTAEREFMTVGIDRTIYKTSDLAVSSGGNATDVLKNIPSVEVDPDDNVSLRGNQNVAIQVNGRPIVLQGDALANFLRGLPAESVERIEIVTNPSAKYDPEGMGGIVNIVLNQRTSRGLSGGVNVSASTNQNYNAGLNLAYGDGPWNLFGSYSLNYGSRGGNGERYRENRIPGLTPIVEQISENNRNFLSHSLNLSTDYSIGTENTLSLAVILNPRDGTGESMNATSERDAGQLLLRRYQRDGEMDDDENSMDYRLSHKLVLEPSKHELTTELRYGWENELDFSSYTQNDVALDGSPSDSLGQRQRVTEDDKSSDYSLQVDYIRPIFGEGSRLEAGYKGEIKRMGGDMFSESFDNTLGAFTPDVALNNSYEYERTIHAVYGTYGHEFGDFSAQVGLRAEQTYSTFDLLTTGGTFQNDYFSLFPSIFLNYKASDALQFKTSYSRRVQRPRTRALNPFVTYDDPQFRQAGNPFLKPEYTDSYEASVVFFADKSTVTLTPFYRHTTDAIRRWDILDSNGITTSTSLNFDEDRSYGVDLIGSIRIGDWMNALASVSGYRTVTSAGSVETDLGSDGFAWNARLNTTFTLPMDFSLQASYSYRAPRVVENGRMLASHMMDFSLQKKLFDDRARVGLRVSDPFGLQGFSMIRDDDQFYQEFERNWNSRGVFLTFSYSFGAQTRQRERDRNGGGGQPSMEMDDEGM